MSFDDLLGDQPDIPDWPGLVRRRISAVRRKRRVAVTLAATSMLVLGTVGAVYATGDSQPSVVALEPTDTPTPEPTETEIPTSGSQIVVIDELSYAPHEATEGDQVMFHLRGHWSASRPEATAYCLDCVPREFPVLPSCVSPDPPIVPAEHPGEGDFAATVTMKGPGTHHVRITLGPQPCPYFSGEDTQTVVIETSAGPSSSPS